MRIFVGNLSDETTKEDLRAAFGAYGSVSRVGVKVDKETGVPKGVGLVEILEPKHAEQAISELNGTRLGDRTIRVREARIRPAAD